MLDSRIKFVNDGDFNLLEREPNMFVEALYPPNVYAVRALVEAGAKVCRWYTCQHGILNLDPVGHVLSSYAMRARVYGNNLARRAWAQPCTVCVQALIDAGPSDWVAEWVGLECAPVLACECLRGIHIRGLESVKLRTVQTH